MTSEALHAKRPQILKFGANAEYEFKEEGCFIQELSNHEADPALSIARARVPPGRVTRWHSVQGATERYVILEGEGRVELDGLPAQEVFPGDVVIIPPDVAQRIANTGNVDLIFLALCTPRFLVENYRALE